ncbi:MAG: hypothetical protein HYV26_17630 [Candidatus Hydrogenedentes bacterium]|nr:hypothetical protein [Candidatus Hydrogenedentota bacterium]
MKWCTTQQGPMHSSWASYAGHILNGAPIGTCPQGQTGIVKQVLRCPGWSYSYTGVLIEPEWTTTVEDIQGLSFALNGGHWETLGVTSGVSCWDHLGPYSGDPDIDLPNSGEVTLHKLREGIERFLITDINNPAATAQAQSTVSVYFDTTRAFFGDPGTEGALDPNEFNHVPGGGNLLFMDGHVEFVKYPAAAGDPVHWLFTQLTVTQAYF